MLAIQRQSGNHEGTFFFSNLPTYLTWTTAWRKKSQEFLISERNLAKKKSGLAAEPRPLRAMPSHYPSS